MSLRLFLFTTCLVVAVPALAFAQNGHAEARHAFELGVQLFDEHNYDAALAELNHAYELEPNYAVLYNLGLVHAALNHSVEAVDALERYLHEGAEHIDRAHRDRVSQELARQRDRIGTIAVVVNVAGAIIALDGHDVARAPVTEPIRAPVGSHSITARAPGYETVEVTMALAGGETFTASFNLRADESHGMLRIVSPLSGVAVTLDGAAIGTTPIDEAIPVAPGTHQVAATRAGYLDYAADVDVRLGGEREVRLRLDVDPAALREHRVGHVDIDVRTSFELRIDGDPAIPRPEGYDLPPGPHAVTVDAAERQPWTGTLTVNAGSTQRFAPPLAWTPTARASRLSGAATLRTLGWSGLIAGIVLTGTSVSLLAWNLGTHSEFETEQAAYVACGANATCTDHDGTSIAHGALKSKVDGLVDQLNIVWVFGGIGLGLGVTALVLGMWALLAAPSDQAIDAAAHAPQVSLGPHGGSLTFVW